MTSPQRRKLSKIIKELHSLSENLKSSFELSRQFALRLAFEEVDKQILQLMKLKDEN